MTVEKERSHDWGSPTIIVGMTNKKARSPPKRHPAFNAGSVVD
jgi:hypothetical protein